MKNQLIEILEKIDVFLTKEKELNQKEGWSFSTKMSEKLNQCITSINNGKFEVTVESINIAQKQLEQIEKCQPRPSKYLIHDEIVSRMCRFPKKRHSEDCLRQIKLLNAFGFGFDFNDSYHDSDGLTSTAIMYFVKKRKKIPSHILNVITEFVKMGLNPTGLERNMFKERTGFGFTLVHLAAKHDDLNLLKAILEHNKDVCISLPDSDGLSALHYAIVHHKAKCTTYLLKNKIDLSLKSRRPVEIAGISFDKGTTAIDVSKQLGTYHTICEQF